LDLGGFSQTIISLAIRSVQKNVVQLGGGTLTIRYGSARDPYTDIASYVSSQEIVNSPGTPAPAVADTSGAVAVGGAATPPLAGDANGDGAVGFADLLILPELRQDHRRHIRHRRLQRRQRRQLHRPSHPRAELRTNPRAARLAAADSRIARPLRRRTGPPRFSLLPPWGRLILNVDWGNIPFDSSRSLSTGLPV
jgi:hypothetical protein